MAEVELVEEIEMGASLPRRRAGIIHYKVFHPFEDDKGEGKKEKQQQQQQQQHKKKKSK